jgi:hypothetical protein
MWEEMSGQPSLPVAPDNSSTSRRSTDEEEEKRRGKKQLKNFAAEEEEEEESSSASLPKLLKPSLKPFGQVPTYPFHLHFTYTNLATMGCCRIVV